MLKAKIGDTTYYVENRPDNGGLLEVMRLLVAEEDDYDVVWEDDLPEGFAAMQTHEFVCEHRDRVVTWEQARAVVAMAPAALGYGGVSWPGWSRIVELAELPGGGDGWQPREFGGESVSRFVIGPQHVALLERPGLWSGCGRHGKPTLLDVVGAVGWMAPDTDAGDLRVGWIRPAVTKLMAEMPVMAEIAAQVAMGRSTAEGLQVVLAQGQLADYLSTWRRVVELDENGAWRAVDDVQGEQANGPYAGQEDR